MRNKRKRGGGGGGGGQRGERERERERERPTRLNSKPSNLLMDVSGNDRSPIRETADLDLMAVLAASPVMGFVTPFLLLSLEQSSVERQTERELGSAPQQFAFNYGQKRHNPLSFPA